MPGCECRPFPAAVPIPPHPHPPRSKLLREEKSKLLRRLPAVKYALKSQSGKSDCFCNLDILTYIPNGFFLTPSSKRERKKNNAQEKCFLYEAIQTFHYLSFSGKTNNSKLQEDTLHGLVLSHFTESRGT